MAKNKIGNQTFIFSDPPSILASASVVGKKESEGPLKDTFDIIDDDGFFGEETWEKAESQMQKVTFKTVLEKANLSKEDIDFVFAGDLLSQCIASGFSMRDTNIPYFGVYGACSTMAETLALGAMAIDGGFADTALAITSSHFCSAERQFRTPLDYGGQRTPTAQWTVTGSGAIILSSHNSGPFITCATIGKIVDAGITDANNMGAAMAPAAYDTLKAHFTDTGRSPSYYDLIVTGDLADLGSQILVELMEKDGFDISKLHNDCGIMIFDSEEQDVQAGGSGCGCAASVLSGHLLSEMADKKLNRILFAATGALLSTVSTEQGESIPSICYAVAIEN